MIVYNTSQAGSTAYYPDVTIPADTNAFAISTGTSSTYANQTIQLRFGSADAPVAAEIKAPDSGWDNYVTTWAKLNNPIKAGTYDVYITFADGGSTNAWWFGFQNRIFSTSTEEIKEVE